MVSWQSVAESILNASALRPSLRASSWPPLRLARRRFERGSLGVVRPPGSQHHQLMSWGGCHGTQMYRAGRPSRVRAGRGADDPSPTTYEDSTSRVRLELFDSQRRRHVEPVGPVGRYHVIHCASQPGVCEVAHTAEDRANQPRAVQRCLLRASRSRVSLASGSPRRGRLRASRLQRGRRRGDGHPATQPPWTSSQRRRERWVWSSDPSSMSSIQNS
jgi:hypothetical protein